LDKLNIDDLIIVYYEGVEYDYKVSEVFIVEPEDLHVEEDLGYHVLTLYTCTPLWTSSKRLVVRAMPI
jgi:LPXTG-site transpeptidase (sortase) family protein